MEKAITFPCMPLAKMILKLIIHAEHTILYNRIPWSRDNSTYRRDGTGSPKLNFKFSLNTHRVRGGGGLVDCEVS